MCATATPPPLVPTQTNSPPAHPAFPLGSRHHTQPASPPENDANVVTVYRGGGYDFLTRRLVFLVTPDKTKNAPPSLPRLP